MSFGTEKSRFQPIYFVIEPLEWKVSRVIHMSPEMEIVMSVCASTGNKRRRGPLNREGYLGKRVFPEFKVSSLSRVVSMGSSSKVFPEICV